MGYRDVAGNVVAEYVYNAFGKLISSSGSLCDEFSFRYSTKYFDAEIALYYYGYRFYCPGLRRWLTRDPIEEAGGENLYGFCLIPVVRNFYKGDNYGRDVPYYSVLCRSASAVADSKSAFLGNSPVGFYWAIFIIRVVHIVYVLCG